jgi:NAD(P)-dependent dehydrogenase (short-subunit alcohol dehydrogenase family)
VDLQLAGRSYLVTGGSTGVGRAVVEVLLAEGAAVTALARRAEPLARLRADLGSTECSAEGSGEGTGDRLDVVPCDVLDEDRTADAVRSVVARRGRLDGVVCGAGAGTTGGVLSTPTAQWRAQFDVKVLGALNTVRPAVEALATSDAGRVVILNGVTAWAPEPDMAAVSAARAALLNLSRSLAVDLAPRGVTVNAVNLGAIVTARQHARHEASGSRLPFEQWCAAEAARRGVLLGRLGTPADVAPLVVMLLSPLAGYLTGGSVDVSGGSGGRL